MFQLCKTSICCEEEKYEKLLDKCVDRDFQPSYKNINRLAEYCRYNQKHIPAVMIAIQRKILKHLQNSQQDKCETYCQVLKVLLDSLNQFIGLQNSIIFLQITDNLIKYSKYQLARKLIISISNLKIEQSTYNLLLKKLLEIQLQDKDNRLHGIRDILQFEQLYYLEHSIIFVADIMLRSLTNIDFANVLDKILKSMAQSFLFNRFFELLQLLQEFYVEFSQHDYNQQLMSVWIDQFISKKLQDNVIVRHQRTDSLNNTLLLQCKQLFNKLSNYFGNQQIYLIYQFRNNFATIFDEQLASLLQMLLTDSKDVVVELLPQNFTDEYQTKLFLFLLNTNLQYQYLELFLKSFIDDDKAMQFLFVSLPNIQFRQKIELVKKQSKFLKAVRRFVYDSCFSNIQIISQIPQKINQSISFFTGQKLIKQFLRYSPVEVINNCLFLLIVADYLQLLRSNLFNNQGQQYDFKSIVRLLKCQQVEPQFSSLYTDYFGEQRFLKELTEIAQSQEEAVEVVRKQKLDIDWEKYIIEF